MTVIGKVREKNAGFFLITKNRGVVVVVVVLAARCLVAACVGIMMPSKQCESASNP